MCVCGMCMCVCVCVQPRIHPVILNVQLRRNFLHLNKRLEDANLPVASSSRKIGKFARLRLDVNIMQLRSLHCFLFFLSFRVGCMGLQMLSRSESTSVNTLYSMLDKIFSVFHTISCALRCIDISLSPKVFAIHASK